MGRKGIWCWRYKINEFRSRSNTYFYMEAWTILWLRVKNGLGTSSQEIKDEEQVLLILLRRLTEVFYILNLLGIHLIRIVIIWETYLSCPVRNLKISACILDAINLIHENKKLYNTKDYVKLNTCCFYGNIVFLMEHMVICNHFPF